jgi:hypothetical protein
MSFQYPHGGPGGTLSKAENKPIFVGCQLPAELNKARSEPYSAVAPATSMASRNALAQGAFIELPDPSPLCDEARCDIERQIGIAAERAVANARLLMIYACFVPSSWEPVACYAAWVNYDEKSRALDIAWSIYQRCLMAPSPPKPEDRRAPALPPSRSLEGNVTVGRLCGGGGGGGWFGGDPFAGCHSEMWEISYDGGISWQPIEVTVCDAT